VRAYAGDWALFTDWCVSTGSRALPADPNETSRAFSGRLWPAAAGGSALA
jgi:hypothetical protein